MYTELDYKNELYHYGVKGMKWGVRRTKEELKYNKSSILSSVNRSLSKNVPKHKNITIRKMSAHSLDRASERKVSSKEILDAARNPLYVFDKDRIDSLGRPSRRFVGRYVTINVNPITGEIVTLWPTGKKTLKKFLKGG